MTIIKGIGIQNFKGFKDYTFCELSDLTLLIGKNGAGKSSFIQAAQFIFSFLSNPSSFRYFPDDKWEMVQINKFVDEEMYKENFTHPTQFMGDINLPMIIDIVTDLSFEKYFKVGEIRYRFLFSTEKHFEKEYLLLSSITLYEQTTSDLLFANTYTNPRQAYNIDVTENGLIFLLNSFLKFIDHEDIEHDASHTLDQVNLKQISKANDTKRTFYTLIDPLRQQMLGEVLKLEPFNHAIQEFNTHHGFDADSILSDVNIFNDELGYYLPNASKELKECLDAAYSYLKQQYLSMSKAISSIIIIKGADIGFPRRTLDTGEVYLKYILQQEYTFNTEFVFSNLLRFNFPGKPIAIKISEDARLYKLILQRKDEKDINLKDCGSGYWILTYLICRLADIDSKGKIVMIEEPEIFLHPGFQASLADMFIEALNNFNMQLIVETHSEYLIKRLQRRVSESQNIGNKPQIMNNWEEISLILRSDQILINYIHDEVNSHSVDVISLTPDGDLSMPFPTDFTDVSIKEELLLFKLKSKN
jgi:predicted ATP-dependent endonuclease of OLD family